MISYLVTGILAILASIAISIASAWFSINGMAAIFISLQLPVMYMTGVLELGKTITAVWLEYNWEKVNKLMKSVLILIVLVLIIFSSSGIFGFLSKAYADERARGGSNDVAIERVQSSIARERQNIERQEFELERYDETVGGFLEIYQRFDNATVGLRQFNETRETRQFIVDSVNNSFREIENLELELQELRIQNVNREANIGPIIYIAQLIYGEGRVDQNTLDAAVRIMILIILLVFDPLAVLLMVAGNIGIKNYVTTRKPINKNIKKVAKKTTPIKRIKKEEPTPVIKKISEIPDKIVDNKNNKAKNKVNFISLKGNIK